MVRHLQRRGPQSREDLHLHFVLGNHAWEQREFEAALSALIDAGHVCPPDQRDVIRLTLRSPL